MVVWLYEGSAGSATRKALVDPIAYLGGVRTPINEVYAYEASKRTLVWSRAPMTATATATQWDTVGVDWTSPGAGADSYTVYRGGTQLYAGTALTVTDTLLDPATAYSYTVNAIRAGATVATVNQAVTTPARTLTLAVDSFTYSSVSLRWTDPVPGSIDQRRVKRGGVAIATVPVGTTTYTDSGLTYNTAYTYTVEALRSGAVVPPVSNTVSQTLTQRPPMMIKRDTFAWDTINMSWTDPAGDAATYMLQRGSTVVSTTIPGTARTYSDAGVLLPSSTYTYTLTARNAAGATIGSVALPMSTGARTAPNLTATAASWNTISVRWPDADKRSITRYDLYRGYWTLLDQGSDQAHDDGGLAASTSYHYLVRSWRGSEQILPDYETDGTTSGRTTSGASVYGPGTGNYSWSECTEKNLPGANFTINPGGYITAFNMNVNGYGDGGRFDPYIDGNRFGWRACAWTGGYPTSRLGDVGTGNWWRDAGAHSIGTYAAGDCNKTQWYGYSGAGNNSIHWGQVNWWWYTNLERDEEMRREPWWSEALALRDIFMERWVDFDGDALRVKVRDKLTDEVLVDWTRG